MVDTHYFLWSRFVMAGLKSFLPMLSPWVGVTPLALYERQRALVSLGVIKSAGGRGPGSGVPFTAENVAAILISLLASDSLSDVDQRVVDLCNARPDIPDEKWIKLGKPTFLTEAGRLLTFHDVVWRPDPKQKAALTKKQWQGMKFRVSRFWRGEIIIKPRQPIEYRPSWKDVGFSTLNSIQVSAETPEFLIWNLISFFQMPEVPVPAGGFIWPQTKEDEE